LIPKSVEEMRKTLICLIYLFMFLFNVMPIWAEGEEIILEEIQPRSSLTLKFDVQAGDEIRFNISINYNFTTPWQGNISRIEFWWEDPFGGSHRYGDIDDEFNWTIPNVYNENGSQNIPINGTWKYVCRNNDRLENITIEYLFLEVKSDNNNQVKNDNNNLLPNAFIIGGIVTISCLGISTGLISKRESLKYSFFLGLTPLYTRLKKKEVLDQLSRGRIFQYITDNPGAHFNRIKSHLSIKNGVLAYHLKVLEEQEYIKSRKDRKFKRFYNIEHTISNNITPLNEIQRKIIKMISNKPEINQVDLAKALNSSPEVVSYNINELKGQGLIKASYEGREVHYNLVGSQDLTKKENNI
jgi:DNA-binding MarR family transcriptional regulator